MSISSSEEEDHVPSADSDFELIQEEELARGAEGSHVPDQEEVPKTTYVQ